MEKLLRANEVAELLGSSTWRVYELARLGQIPSVRFGRTVRFSESELEKWIREGGPTADPTHSQSRSTVG
ncbi:MAG: helix-turn-helix domain-containing protein [bacterium]|nr:helix-turn-helix domain-containing protein [bacterium]